MEKYKDTINQQLKIDCVKLLFCCCVYSMLITFNLVNKQDGMWNGPYYWGGDWELSLGRWAIRYLDKLHFGIATNPWNAILTLLIFSIGTDLLCNLLKIKKGSWTDYLISFLFLSNIIVCDSLSYAYTSLVFAVAFVFSMLCVKMIELLVEHHADTMELKQTFVWIMTGAICMAVVMGLYQSYLGCILVALLGYFLMRVCDEKDPISLIGFFKNSILVAFFGFIFYEIILWFELIRHGVSMSSYNGADAISLSTILKNLIPACKRAYTEFFDYFAGKSFRWNMQHAKLIMLVMGVVFLAIVIAEIVHLVKRRNILYIVLFLVMYGLIPVATNITFFLAPGSGYMEQQTAPIALVVSVVFALLFTLLEQYKEKFYFVIKACAIFMAVFVLWGNIYQTQEDQEAMKEGIIATETLAQNIFNRLVEDGLYEQGKDIVLVGSPSESTFFTSSEMYEWANGYAQVAGRYWNSKLSMWTWRGVFNHRLGVYVPFREDVEPILQMQEVKDMPLYPQEGSIQEIDGSIVVKISN